MQDTSSISKNFIHVSGVKGEGSIVAAKDDEHSVIIYLDPDGYALGAIMDVQRAVKSLNSQGSQVEAAV